MPRYTLAFSPESLKEIERIILFYNNASKGLGARFKKSLLTELALIKRNPLTRSFRYGEVRFAVIKKFPYAAHYTIDEDTHIIKIQGVFGFSQDSESNWKQRF